MIGQYWHVTADERERTHPADLHAATVSEHVVRAVDVDAEPATVYRWLCQLKVAPYSYDIVDNLGRRSPRTLTPGAENLALGQRFMIGRIVAFERDGFICADSDPIPTALFGQTTMSYQVVPGVSSRSRIVACLAVAAGGPIARVRLGLLTLGDLVMMRKQLLTLRDCAERAASVT